MCATGAAAEAVLAVAAPRSVAQPGPGHIPSLPRVILQHDDVPPAPRPADTGMHP
jgi:hypothetical protein